MNRPFFPRILLPVFCGMTLAACQSGSDNAVAEKTSVATAAVHSRPEMPAERPKTSPGKPSAPITIDYEIMGKPVIGIPLSINVKISSALDQPIRVNYRINDSTSLMFTNAQSRTVSLLPAGDEAYPAEQVTVIPQREGRLFLNVSAEIETDVGMMAKVMAIPIQVGRRRPAPQVSGELTTGEAGEALISLPAKEE